MKIISKIKWGVLGIFLPMLSLAAISVPAPSGAVTTDLKTVVTNLLNTVMGLVGLVAVIVVVYGGILLATSGGDEDKSKSGKNYITYGIIGLVVIILAYSIINFVVSTIG